MWRTAQRLNDCRLCRWQASMAGCTTDVRMSVTQCTATRDIAVIPAGSSIPKREEKQAKTSHAPGPKDHGRDGAKQPVSIKIFRIRNMQRIGDAFLPSIHGNGKTPIPINTKVKDVTRDPWQPTIQSPPARIKCVEGRPTSAAY